MLLNPTIYDDIFDDLLMLDNGREIISKLMLVGKEQLITVKTIIKYVSYDEYYDSSKCFIKESNSSDLPKITLVRI